MINEHDTHVENADPEIAKSRAGAIALGIIQLAAVRPIVRVTEGAASRAVHALMSTHAAIASLA